MSEYIDREALRDALYEEDAITMRGVAILERFPAADVAPVRHGHWIPHDDELGLTMECSACHVEGVIHGDYCPVCGARMDGEA